MKMTKKNKQNLITAFTVFFIFLLFSVAIIVFVADVRKASDRSLPVSCVDDRCSLTLSTSGVYPSVDTPVQPVLDRSFVVVPFLRYGTIIFSGSRCAYVSGTGATYKYRYTSLTSFGCLFSYPLNISFPSDSSSVRYFSNSGAALSTSGNTSRATISYCQLSPGNSATSFVELEFGQTVPPSFIDFPTTTVYKNNPVYCILTGQITNLNSTTNFSPSNVGCFFFQPPTRDFVLNAISRVDLRFVTLDNTVPLDDRAKFSNGAFIPWHTSSLTDFVFYTIYDVNGNFFEVSSYIPSAYRDALLFSFERYSSPSLITPIGLANDTSSYNAGYNSGYNIGFDAGKNSGYSSGYKIGYDNGNSAGFSAGVASANDYSFLGLIGSVIDAPIQAFMGLLSFDVLGVNLSTFVLTLFTFCIILKIVSYVL